MRNLARLIASVSLILCAIAVSAASKPHIVTLGKSTSVKIFVGANEDKPVDLKIRTLYVDGRLKEYTFGVAHEITERLYVVRRIVRVNDALPEETAPHWTWQRSGWLVIDRVSGHVSQAGLGDFDPDVSSSAWFRDYVAYCGISDDRKKSVAVVQQLGRRKAILKKSLGDLDNAALSESLCVTPTWQRQPMRVTFTARSGEKFVYEVQRHSVESVADDDDDPE